MQKSLYISKSKSNSSFRSYLQLLEKYSQLSFTIGRKNSLWALVKCELYFQNTKSS